MPALPSSLITSLSSAPAGVGAPAATGGLLTALSALPDPRARRGVRHGLAVVVTAAICAVVAGYRSYTAIGEWVADLPAETAARVRDRRRTPPLGDNDPPAVTGPGPGSADRAGRSLACRAEAGAGGNSTGPGCGRQELAWLTYRRHGRPACAATIAVEPVMPPSPAIIHGTARPAPSPAARDLMLVTATSPKMTDGGR
ncbi:transposase family protein [Micromonospora sp. CPCC 206061]|uniref:transposase family protein n=1 Tax=Micromonospora sp. CPCC 206061 TaxID=3122410 RepID=UPI002FEEFF5B